MYRVVRHGSTKVAKNSEKSKLIIDSAEDGAKIACIPEPSYSKGVSRVAIAVKGGSKYESILGMSHFVRRCFGISTPKYTSINLIRHLEQIGAQVKVTGSREHILYTIDCAPNLMSRAGYIVAQLISDCAYYGWELGDSVYPLMKQDIELHNRMHHGARTLNLSLLFLVCSDLLHEAAFGKNICGTGLGNSLYATREAIGTFPLDSIKEFHDTIFAPYNCTVALVDAGSGFGYSDPMETLNEIRSGFHFNPPGEKSKIEQTHDFIANDVRREIVTAPTVHVMVGNHVHFGKDSEKKRLALAVAARALDGANCGNIKYADGHGGTTPLSRTAGAGEYADFITNASSIFHSYSDHGIFGFSVAGSCAKATGARTVACYRTLKKLVKKGLSEEDIEKGKSILSMEVLADGEAVSSTAVDLALQVCATGDYTCPGEVAQTIDKLCVEDVNKAYAEVCGSGKPALSAVGKGLRYIPPVNAM